MSDAPLPKKSLGQHWLTDQDSLEAMCEAAEVSADDTILEIGPGLGALTELLVQSAGSVVAVEFDEKLASQLPGRVQSAQLEIVNQDILHFDFTTMPPHYKVVANIPYYLTSNLVRVMSETPNPPTVAVILVQKEVAQRVAARPGAMSILSVSAQYYWEVSLGRIVDAELFIPPPKVDSQILILSRRPKPLFEDISAKEYFRLVKAGFGQRRKTLANSLSGGLSLSREAVTELCVKAGIEPTRRAQTLSLEDWHRLCKSLNT